MIRLIYVSQSKDIDFDTVKAILSTSHEFNKTNKISGALVYGKGYFIQCLEGEDSTVEALYKKIILDTRHEHIELISKEKIQESYFNAWHISFMNEGAYQMMEKRYTRHGVYNPYSMRPEQLIMMLDELSKVV